LLRTVSKLKTKEQTHVRVKVDDCRSYFHLDTDMDGRVLLCSGIQYGLSGFGWIQYPNNHGVYTIYDPSSDNLAQGWSMPNAALHNTATLLADGTVLVAGGQWDTYLVLSHGGGIFDPAASVNLIYGQMHPLVGNMSISRYGATVARLGNGSVLIAGGTTFDGNSPVPTATVERHVTDDIFGNGFE
jgi:hypothetical protein